MFQITYFLAQPLKIRLVIVQFTRKEQGTQIAKMAIDAATEYFRMVVSPHAHYPGWVDGHFLFQGMHIISSEAFSVFPAPGARRIV